MFEQFIKPSWCFYFYISNYAKSCACLLEILFLNRIDGHNQSIRTMWNKTTKVYWWACWHSCVVFMHFKTKLSCSYLWKCSQLNISLWVLWLRAPEYKMYVHLEVIFDKAFLPVDKIDSKIFIHINLLVQNDSRLWTFYSACSAHICKWEGI